MADTKKVKSGPQIQEECETVGEDDHNLVTLYSRGQDRILQLEDRLRQWEACMEAQDRYVALRVRMEGLKPLALGQSSILTTDAATIYGDMVPAGRDYTQGGKVIPNQMGMEMLVACPCGEGFHSPSVPCDAGGCPGGLRPPPASTHCRRGAAEVGPRGGRPEESRTQPPQAEPLREGQQRV